MIGEEGREGTAGRTICGVDEVRNLAEERKGEDAFLVEFKAAAAEAGVLVAAAKPVAINGFCLYWS